MENCSKKTTSVSCMADVQEASDVDLFEMFNDILQNDPVLSVVERMSVLYMYVYFSVGLLTNGLTILTVHRIRDRAPSSLLLTTLAFFDAAALMAKLVEHVIDYNIYPVGTVSCVMNNFNVAYCTSLANWNIVFMAIERFISIRYPLKKLYLVSRRRCKQSIAVLALVLLLVLGPFCAIFVEEGDIDLCKSKIISLQEFYWYMNTIYIVLPLALVSVFTSAIIHALCAPRKFAPAKSHDQKMVPSARQAVLKRERLEAILTKWMILSIGVFVLLTVPSFVITLVYSTFDYKKQVLLNDIQMVIFDSSHVVNFFLYFAASKRFRKQLFKIIFCAEVRK